MSLSLAVNTLTIIQKFVYTPCISTIVGNSQNIQFTSQPFHQNRFAQFFWKLSKVYNTLLIAQSIWQIRNLQSNWDGDQSLNQLSFYVFALALVIIALYTYTWLEKSEREIVYCLNQAHNLVPISGVGFQSFCKRCKRFQIGAEETICYAFASTFAAFPLAAILLPFVHDFGPIQTTFQQFGPTGMSKSWIQCGASVTHEIFALHGASTLLCFMLISIVVGESMIKFSSELIPILQKNKMRQRQLLSNYSTLKRSLKLYRILQIGTQTVNNFVINFFFFVLAMDVLLVSSTGYAALLHYGRIPFLLYLAYCIMTGVGFSVVFILVFLASTPYKNGEAFRATWTQMQLGKRGRIELGSCPPIGYCLGYLRIVKNSTSLSITDVMVNSIANLALLDGSFQNG